MPIYGHIAEKELRTFLSLRVMDENVLKGHSTDKMSLRVILKDKMRPLRTPT